MPAVGRMPEKWGLDGSLCRRKGRWVMLPLSPTGWVLKGVSFKGSISLAGGSAQRYFSVQLSACLSACLAQLWSNCCLTGGGRLCRLAGRGRLYQFSRPSLSPTWQMPEAANSKHSFLLARSLAACGIPLHTCHACLLGPGAPPSLPGRDKVVPPTMIPTEAQLLGSQKAS